jgi:hypothetical protein
MFIVAVVCSEAMHVYRRGAVWALHLKQQILANLNKVLGNRHYVFKVQYTRKNLTGL